MTNVPQQQLKSILVSSQGGLAVKSSVTIKLNPDLGAISTLTNEELKVFDPPITYEMDIGAVITKSQAIIK